MVKKLPFKRRPLLMGTLSAIIFGFIVWLLFKPEYKFHYYKLNDCDNSYLTAVVYRKLGERGVILAKGKHTDIPINNTLIFKDLSSFDAYFRAVATCESGTIIVNSIEHFFYKQQGSKDIKPRVVYTDIYKKSREEKNGIEINLY